MLTPFVSKWPKKEREIAVRCAFPRQAMQISAGMRFSTWHLSTSDSKFRSRSKVSVPPPEKTWLLPALSRLSDRMTRWALVVPLLVGLLTLRAAGQEAGNPEASPPPPGPPSDGSTQAGDESEDWGLNSLRGGFEAVSGYFDSMLEFMGGKDGVCQYRCRHGKSDPD